MSRRSSPAVAESGGMVVYGLSTVALYVSLDRWGRAGGQLAGMRPVPPRWGLVLRVDAVERAEIDRAVADMGASVSDVDVVPSWLVRQRTGKGGAHAVALVWPGEVVA